MTDPRERESRPSAGAAVSTDRITSRVPRRHVSRPDLWAKYPDPAIYLARPTMFGLTLDAYRAEYRRRQAESWQFWELELRFPAPATVTR